MEYYTFIIIIAVALISFKLKKIFNVPKEFQHLPRVPFFKLMVAKFNKMPYDEQYQQILKPALKQCGLALIWMRGEWEVLVSNPHLIKEIITDNDNFLKATPEPGKFSSFLMFYQFLGSSNILLNNGEEWQRHRRIANPAFKKIFDTCIFGACVKELIIKIKESHTDPIFIQSLFQRLTLDALGRGMFSYDFEAVKKNESSYYLQLYNEVMAAVFNPLYQTFPFLEVIIPSRRYYHKKNAEFRHFLMGIIKEREIEVQNGTDKEDLLSSIIRSSLEEKDIKGKLSRVEVLNDLAVFFFAGHDTTSNTLSTIMFYLAKYPEIQEKARKEINEVLGESDKLIVPSNEQLQSLTYVGCIIKEAMRIITTVAQLHRKSKKNITLSNGFVIPATTHLLLSTWSVHHNEEIFPNPDQFQPERFKEEHNLANQSTLGFGAGSRMCLGIKFSLVEQKVTIAMLLQQFNIVLGPQCKQYKKPLVTHLDFTYPINLDLQFLPRTTT